jgi:hypothetical protein
LAKYGNIAIPITADRIEVLGIVSAEIRKGESPEK